MRLFDVKRGLGALLLLATASLLSGCDMALMSPKGQVGLEQKSLILTALGLMLIVVIPVIIMTVAFARKYRASNTTAKYTPDWSHSNKIEAVVWTVPVIIVAILAVITGVVDQIRRWMAVPQPVDTTQFTGWRTGIPSPISLFITFTPARISPTWAL